MGDLLYFPLRRMCVLGIPGPVVEALQAEMPFVAISTDGAALQRCDLLVVDGKDRGAPELASWIHRRMPDFPVIFWDVDSPGSGDLVEACRRRLFPAA